MLSANCKVHSLHERKCETQESGSWKEVENKWEMSGRSREQVERRRDSTTMPTAPRVWREMVANDKWKTRQTHETQSTESLVGRKEDEWAAGGSKANSNACDWSYPQLVDFVPPTMGRQWCWKQTRALECKRSGHNRRQVQVRYRAPYLRGKWQTRMKQGDKMGTGFRGYWIQPPTWETSG